MQFLIFRCALKCDNRTNGIVIDFTGSIFNEFALFLVFEIPAKNGLLIGLIRDNLRIIRFRSSVQENKLYREMF